MYFVKFQFKTNEMSGPNIANKEFSTEDQITKPKQKQTFVQPKKASYESRKVGSCTFTVSIHSSRRKGVRNAEMGRKLTAGFPSNLLFALLPGAKSARAQFRSTSRTAIQ